MSKRHKLHKKYSDEPAQPGEVWIEGHVLNDKTGKLEPVRYKLKGKYDGRGR